VSADAGDGFVFDPASFDEGSQELLSAHSELEGAGAESAGVQGSAGEQLRQWLPTIPAADTLDQVQGIADEALSQATDITSTDAGNLLTQKQTMLDTEADLVGRIDQIGGELRLPDFGGADGEPGNPVDQLLSGCGDDLPGDDLPGAGGPAGDLPDGDDGTGDEPGPGGGDPAEARSLREAAADPDAAARPIGSMTTGGDPVDVATGDVVLGQVDVRLPGLLPLIVRRAHRSSWRAGRWFGRSWASTLDQRLEVTGDGVFVAMADGTVLCYPHPGDDGEPVWPAAGARWPLARDPAGYTVTDPQAGIAWRFEPRPGFCLWPEAGFGEFPLVSVTARPGDQISFGYGPDGAPVSISHSGGYQVRVHADGGRITALALAGAGEGAGDVVLTRYRYDKSGNLAEVVNSSGLPLRMSYDAAGRLAGWQDRNGWCYRYAYDELGRCVRGDGPGGTLSATFAYDQDSMVTTCTDAAGAVTAYQVTGRSQVAAVTGPLGNVTRSDHDEYGRMVSRADPLGRVTSWSYDSAGNLALVTLPDGSQATAEYSELNLPVLVTEPGGAAWRQGYDTAGNLIQVTGPDGAVTRFTYDGHGHLASMSNPLGAVTTVECDEAGLPVAVTGPDGAVTRYDRDTFGRMTAVTGPDGAVTRLGWTIEGRLASRTFPDGTAERFRYDGEGNLVGHVNPAAGLTRFEYGCFDQVTARTGPDGTRTELGYDHALRLTTVTHGGLTWRYGYDPAGRLTTQTDYDGAATRYSRDAAGQLTGRVNGAGQQLSYGYDLLGNLASRDADGVIATFRYDAAGRLTRAENPDAVVVLERDAAGRMTAETCNGRTVRSDYDAAGRRVRRVTPSGAETFWGYDSSGRPVRMQTAGQAISFGYDQAGRETRRGLPGGVALTQDWDPAGRLAAQILTCDIGHGPAAMPSLLPSHAEQAALPADSSGRLLQRRGYTYRPDGYLAHADELLSGPLRYTLDPAGRITAVTGPNWAEHYAYDPAGNIIHAAWPVPGPGPAGPASRPGPADPASGPGLADPWQATGAQEPRSDVQGPRLYAGTLVTRAGRIRYQHDRHGRITARHQVRDSRKPASCQYTWDAEDRLTAVTTPDGTRWRYLYDPLGRRIAKQRLGPDGAIAEQATFTWDGPVLAEQHTTTDSRSLSWHADAAAADGAAAEHVITWDYRPGTFTPLAQTERHRFGDAPQEEIDQRFYAVVTDLIGTPSELVDPGGALAGYQQHTLWGTTTWRPGGANTPLRFPGQYADPETGLHYNNQRYYDPATGSYLTPDPLGLAPALNPHAYVPNPTTSLDPLGLCNNAAEDEGDLAFVGPPTAPSPEAAFHYTSAEAAESIMRSGLRPGSYATPNGELSGLQAQIDLALPPNRGLPDAAVQVDVAGLHAAGYEIPDVTQVTRSFGMPGGGWEMQFPYEVPSQFLKVVSNEYLP
jgi:RHS repeat-associated protein